MRRNRFLPVCPSAYDHQWAADRHLAGMCVNYGLGRLPHELEAARKTTFIAHGCDLKLLTPAGLKSRADQGATRNQSGTTLWRRFKIECLLHNLAL